MTRALLLTLAFALVAATPAAAQSPGSFVMPSKKIGCTVTGSAIRCDVIGATNTPPRKPASCDLDYGFAFTMGSRGSARRICHGDTVIAPGSRVLRYGTTFRRSGFTCTSRASGLTCRNRTGRGFTLSRQRQRVF